MHSGEAQRAYRVRRRLLIAGDVTQNTDFYN